MSNGQDDFLAQLERKAIAEGLQFIEELVFENGAVYKGTDFNFIYKSNQLFYISIIGYLKDGMRHGPGT